MVKLLCRNSVWRWSFNALLRMLSLCFSLEYSSYSQTQTPFAVDLTQRLLLNAFRKSKSAVRELEKKAHLE